MSWTNALVSLVSLINVLHLAITCDYITKLFNIIIVALITIIYLHPTYLITFITGLVLFLFLGGLGGITSSTYWNKRYGSQKGSWGNLIDSFKENTKYVYSIYLKLNDKGYNENYYFDKNTKLINAPARNN